MQNVESRTKICIVPQNVVKRSTIIDVVCRRGHLKRNMDRDHLQTCDMCMSDFFSDVHQYIFTFRLLALSIYLAFW